MKSAVKIPLVVSDHEAAVLDGQSRIANWLYNRLLEIANELREQYRKSQNKAIGKRLYTERGLRDLIPELKDKHPFLKVVYSSPLKNAALRLSLAIKHYQDGKKGKRKKPVNWPRFKSWKRCWFSLQWDEPWKGYCLEGRKLHLVLGKDVNNHQLHLTVQLAEALPSWVHLEDVRQCRIVKDGLVYSVVFTVERTLPKSGEIKRVVAIDPNHKNFGYAVGTDGVATEMQNPYFLKTLDKRVDKLKAKRDTKQKKAKKITGEDGSTIFLPSRQWRYLNMRLQEVYRIRREQTKVYLYTVANKLFKHYDVVGVGDYVPRGGGINRKMRRAMNNQSLNRRFKQIVAWVALRSGKKFLEWEEGGSTRTCHDCGYVVADGIPVSIREWDCPNDLCLVHHIRDENAARNGLHRVLKAIGLPCSGPVGISLRRTWRFSGLGLPSGGRWRVLRQESASKEFNRHQAGC